MHGDFDRVTFDPTKQFADVLIQQGRLLLSADWNERGAIYNHFLRMLIVDLVGRHWRAGGGFTIGNAAGEATISKGHYYIDGILCENPSNCSFADQPYGPIAEEIDALKKAQMASTSPSTSIAGSVMSPRISIRR